MEDHPHDIDLQKHYLRLEASIVTFQPIVGASEGKLAWATIVEMLTRTDFESVCPCRWLKGFCFGASRPERVCIHLDEDRNGPKRFLLHDVRPPLASYVGVTPLDDRPRVQSSHMIFLKLLEYLQSSVVVFSAAFPRSPHYSSW